MSVLELTVNRAIQKNWIPSQDKEPVIQKIKALSDKFGFDPDDFATFTHIESYGMNPKALNYANCAGIIQFCPDSGGVKKIGGQTYVTKNITNLSILEQLNLVDGYFEGLIPPSQRKNIDLGRLYFYVLYPAIAMDWDNIGPDDDISGRVGKQASTFYVNGRITKASTIKGVKQQAEKNLNTEITPGQNFGIGGGTNGASALGGSIAQNNSESVNGITSISLGTCSEIFPIEFSLKEALHYVGCFSRQIANPMSGATNLGYSANGMQVNGASHFNIADFNPTVPICDGCLGFPFKKKIRITSPFCQRRVSKSSGRTYYHSGTDYGGFEGDEVIAVADGTVVTPLVSGGYNPGLVDIVHEQLGNLVSRSAHIIPSVQPGSKVKQGDVIGKVGPYPSGGPHLHLELRKDKGAGGSAFSEAECLKTFLDPALFCKRS
jgi:murein DD-endopeptidase MepM/ murein hydrolase activator NlpD